MPAPDRVLPLEVRNDEPGVDRHGPVSPRDATGFASVPLRLRDRPVDQVPEPRRDRRVGQALEAPREPCLRTSAPWARDPSASRRSALLLRTVSYRDSPGLPFARTKCSARAAYYSLVERFDCCDGWGERHAGGRLASSFRSCADYSPLPGARLACTQDLVWRDDTFHAQESALNSVNSGFSSRSPETRASLSAARTPSRCR